MIEQARRTSYTGGRGFEKALRNVFESMGFSAEHDGRSGRPDVFVVATVGPEDYSFTVEAKGSKDDIDNDRAGVSAAANHGDEVTGFAPGANREVVAGRGLQFCRQR